MGCGHAGIINILSDAGAEFPNRAVYGVVGGIHLFAATDEQLDWTADEMKEFHVANLLGAHCPASKPSIACAGAPASLASRPSSPP